MWLVRNFEETRGEWFKQWPVLSEIEHQQQKTNLITNYRHGTSSATLTVSMNVYNLFIVKKKMTNFGIFV